MYVADSRLSVAKHSRGADSRFRRALLLRFAVENRDRIAVERLGASLPVSDAYRAKLVVLGERTDQAEYDPLLSRAIEIQLVIHRDIYKVIRGQAFVCRVLEIIRCNIVARLTGRRAMQPATRLIITVGQKLQRRVRMSRPAFAEGDLDSGVLPMPSAFSGDEVYTEPAQHALSHQHFRHPPVGFMYTLTVCCVGSKRTAQKDLARKVRLTPVVGRNDTCFAQRVDETLYRR